MDVSSQLSDNGEDVLDEMLNDETSSDIDMSTLLSIQEKTSKKPRKPAARAEHKWTDDETMKLIICVEPRPVIWDFGTAGYSKTPIRDAAWREIVPLFDDRITQGQMQIKWQNLRNQFRKEDAKMKKTTSGQAAGSRQSKWRFYEAMAFVGAAERELNTISESNLTIETVIVFILGIHQISIKFNCVLFASFKGHCGRRLITSMFTVDNCQSSKQRYCNPQTEGRGMPSQFRYLQTNQQRDANSG